MAKMIRRFHLKAVRETVQPVDMPKRARVLLIYPGIKHGTICMDAEQVEDADTKAFDRTHHRYFQVCSAGDVIPDGALAGSVSVLINGESRAYHVYEVRGR